MGGIEFIYHHGISFNKGIRRIKGRRVKRGIRK